MATYSPGSDPWEEMFKAAALRARDTDSEMEPYWVFNEGPARIERYAPILPFSREAVTLPRLRKTLAAYRIAFGQPRQQELVEYLGERRTDGQLLELAERIRIDLTP